MKTSIKPLSRLILIFFCLVSSGSFAAEPAKTYDLPLRFIARAEVNRIRYDYYTVRECLDVYNDDNLNPLVINGVTADYWRGHQIEQLAENWFTGRQQLIIAPGSKKRVVERKHTVLGRRKRDWWVRWIRFNIFTNRGQFVSNFVASPFKRPGKILSEHREPAIDTLSEPGALSPIQQEIGGKW